MIITILYGTWGYEQKNVGSNRFCHCIQPGIGHLVSLDLNFQKNNDTLILKLILVFYIRRTLGPERQGRIFMSKCKRKIVVRSVFTNVYLRLLRILNMIKCICDFSRKAYICNSSLMIFFFISEVLFPLDLYQSNVSMKHIWRNVGQQI